jgi:ABC-type multidrug transport system ATPase subunit
VGYLFPDPIDKLVEYLSVAQQLVFAAQLRGLRIGRAEIDATLERFGLSHRHAHRPAQLSGGEQQRVGVACSLVGDLLLVLGDEPTAELDSASADAVLDCVPVLCASGSAVVMASHDPRVIERADHLLQLERGRVVQSW